jgi:hypothetical protein
MDPNKAAERKKKKSFYAKMKKVPVPDLALARKTMCFSKFRIRSTKLEQVFVEGIILNPITLFCIII